VRKRVVLVHGAVETGCGFAEVVRRLPNCDVVTYDRRGNGADWARLPSAAGLGEHVDDLLDALDDKPSIVVGHSLGGAVGLVAALRRPDLVQQLAIYETALPAEDWWSQREREAMMATISANTRHALSRTDLAEERRAKLGAAWEACRRDVVALSAHRIPWRELVVPLTVGVGTVNKGTSARDARRLAEELSADLVVLRGAGHSAHRTHPGLFAGLVRRVVMKAAGEAPPLRRAGKREHSLEEL
jgi:pimeloyl-ACP methyl ester carboxylesterase